MALCRHRSTMRTKDRRVGLVTRRVDRGPEWRPWSISALTRIKTPITWTTAVQRLVRVSFWCICHFCPVSDNFLLRFDTAGLVTGKVSGPHNSCAARLCTGTRTSGGRKLRTVYHHNRFTALFPWPPGWAGARRELLDFMVQGKINRGRHTDHPAGRHSIQTNQCPLPPSPHFLQAGCPSCCPTNSVKALKATSTFGLGRRC